MTTIPDFLPMLRHGTGKTPREGGCIMQVCDFLDRGAWTANAANAAANAANAAANAANAAADAGPRLTASARRLADFVALLDEFDRLTNRTQQDLPVVSEGEWQRIAQAVAG